AFCDHPPSSRCSCHSARTGGSSPLSLHDALPIYKVGVMYLGRLVEWADTATLFSRPLHPYTRMLLDAIPDLNMSGRQRTPVAGEVPSPLNPPPGCTFHPRCPLANERCRREVPRTLPAPGGEVACHAVEEGRLPPWKAQAAACRHNLTCTTRPGRYIAIGAFCLFA